MTKSLAAGRRRPLVLEVANDCATGSSNHWRRRINERLLRGGFGLVPRGLRFATYVKTNLD